MSRSRALAVTVVTLLFALSALPARAQELKVVDAVGNVDYVHGRSSIRVGTWAKYHIKNVDENGVIEEYNSTILIAGEEEFWGEDCFWIETHTERADGGPGEAATLVSYSIFDDSLAVPHLQVYQRKKLDPVIAGSTDTMVPRIMRQGENVLRSRNPFGTNLTWMVDTLGSDTVRTPRGTYLCRIVRQRQGAGQLAESADSSRYTEVHKSRTIYETLSVPITHMAHEEIVSEATVRTWLIGRSKEAGPARSAGRSVSTVDLVDFGTGGLEATLVPERFRHTLAEQRAAARVPHRATTPARKTTGTPARH